MGIILCVASVLPLFLTLIFFGEGATPEESFPHVASLGLLLAIAAGGVYLIVRSSTVWGGYQMLLEEGGYSRTQKTENKRNETISTVYWCAVTAGYLAWSFLTNDWQKTWIVWPVAGVLFGLVQAVAKSMRSKG